MTPQNRNWMKTKIILILCFVSVLFLCFICWRVDNFFVKPRLARRQANCLFIRVDRPNKPRKKFEMSSKGSGKYPEPDAERDTDVASGPSQDISYRDKKCAYEIFIRVSHCELTFRHLQINVDTCPLPKNHSFSTKPNEKKSKTKLKATSRLNFCVLPNPLQNLFIFNFRSYLSQWSFIFFYFSPFFQDPFCIHTEASEASLSNGKQRNRHPTNFSSD